MIIKFSSLGDVILSTAAIRAIREKFKNNYKISFLVGAEAKDALSRCPYIDELIVADLKNKDKGLKGLFGLGALLRKKNFDIVIDLQNNRKSHILSFLTLSPARVGYDNKKFGFLLNRRIKDDPDPVDPVTHQFRALKTLGIEPVEPRLELWPTEEDEKYVEELLSSQWLSSNQKVIGINVSASPRWLTKCWPREHLVKFCQELGEAGMRIVFTGTERDMETANYLGGRLKNVKIINACARTTINQLACLIKKCNVYITADSSPLHVAAAMGTPFVALFGPTDPRRHLAPAKKFLVIKKDLACSPCYRSKCKDKKCMSLITPEEVLEAVKRLLE